jgi:hypothetical protein
MYTKILLGALAGVILVFAGLVLLSSDEPTIDPIGNSNTGFVAIVSTTSPVTVGPQERLVWFSGRSNQPRVDCAARIISTGGRDISLTFSGTSSSTATSTLSLTLASGHIQLASTTVTYPVETYGCGYIGLRGYGATSTIIITETR